MFGVILWSNAVDRKAVIWCEDQGDLAYYEDIAPYSGGFTSFFDAGDYVEFDVTTEETLRRAHNPTSVMDRHETGNIIDARDFVSGALIVHNIDAECDDTATVVSLADHRPPTSVAAAQVSRLG